MKKRKILSSDYIDLGSGIPVYGYKSKSISEGTDLSLKIQGKKSKPNYVHLGSGRKWYGI